MSYIQWTLEEPQNSRMFSSWGVNYRCTTESRSGRSVTTLRGNGARGNVVATIHWGRGGDPGRIYIGTHCVPITDFLRLDLISPFGCTRSFTGPRGLHLMWAPDSWSHSLFLVDNSSHNYGRLDPIPPRQVAVNGRIRTIGHILTFTLDLDPNQKEWILVTIVLYRCLATLGAGQ